MLSILGTIHPINLFAIAILLIDSDALLTISWATLIVLLDHLIDSLFISLALSLHLPIHSVIPSITLSLNFSHLHCFEAIYSHFISSYHFLVNGYCIIVNSNFELISFSI